MVLVLGFGGFAGITGQALDTPKTPTLAGLHPATSLKQGRRFGFLAKVTPGGSKDPNNRVLGPKYYDKWYLGPKTLSFGSLDPQGH